MGGITQIDPGEVGLVVKQFGEDRGMQEFTLDTGTHWIEPFSNDVIVVDTRLNRYPQLDIPSNTKDGQPILVDVVFEIGLMDHNVPNLIENIGTEWYDKVVYPAARSAIRNNTSELMSDEVYTGEGRARIQEQLTNELGNRLETMGIRITANLSDIEFTNTDFVATLERKAKAAQEETIQARLAEAAKQEAIKVQNTAEGEKFKREQAAEANKYELQQEGEGERLKQEEIAKGILAVGQAEADVIKLKANALSGSGGVLYRDIQVLGGLGEAVEFYGVPTGAEGTNTYIVDEALRGKVAIGGN
jgi:regulator of protease activity HflC (stomatin/prohibitin superfamily)